MAVSEARDLGKIKKRNIKKIDSKVNDIIDKYVTDHDPKYRTTVPEKVLATSKGFKSHRVLPKPDKICS